MSHCFTHFLAVNSLAYKFTWIWTPSEGEKSSDRACLRPVFVWLKRQFHGRHTRQLS